MPLRVMPSGLEDHIKNNKVTTLANCWRITRYDGVVFRFVDCDVEVELSDGVYTPASSGSASALENTVEPSSDNLTITQILDSEYITVDDLNAGLFDGAKVEIYLVNYKDPRQGTTTLFVGFFGEVSFRDDVDFEVELKSISTKLSQTIGRSYTQQCDADFADERCGISGENYTISGEITDVVSKTKLKDSSVSESEDWFKYGVFEFTSGYNTGQKYEIKGYSGNIAISTVDTNNNIFGLQGSELSEFSVGATFDVVNSTGNDGTYTVAALDYDDQLGQMTKDNSNYYDIIKILEYVVKINGDPFNLSDADDENDGIKEGDKFDIVNSRSYNGEYEVLSVSYNSSDGITEITTVERLGWPNYVGITKITTEENISDSTADGEISYNQNGVFELWISPPFKVQVGDSYKARAGCDKYFNTCKNKYNNVVNFRGFPHIPGRDEVTKYPNAKQ